MFSVQTRAATACIAGLIVAACAGVSSCVREGSPRPSVAPSPALRASPRAPAPVPPAVSSSALPGRRCTERACVDQTSVSSAAGLVRVVGFSEGKETAFECAARNAAPGAKSQPSLDPSCEGTSLTVPLVFDTVRVTTRTGTVTVTPTYETFEANGPGCPGTCRVARVVLP